MSSLRSFTDAGIPHLERFNGQSAERLDIHSMKGDHGDESNPHEEYEDHECEKRSSSVTPHQFTPINEAHATSNSDITTSLSSTSTESEIVDIIIYTFGDDGVVCKRTHAESVAQLKQFWLENWNQISGMSFLLLVVDISTAIAEVIDQYVDFSGTSAEEHLKGRVNEPTRTDECDHIDTIHSTLFDHHNQKKDIESLTWWRLCAHSREGYIRETEALDNCNADTRKITFPPFELSLADTRTSSPPDKSDLRDRISASVQHSRTVLARKGGLMKAGASGEMSDEPEFQPKIVKSLVKRCSIQTHTYRPHQVVTETQHDSWGAAAEERVTCHGFEDDGSAYYIMLFDKPRELNEVTETFIQEVNNWKSAVPPKMTRERVSRVLPTFQRIGSVREILKRSHRSSWNPVKPPVAQSTDRLDSTGHPRTHGITSCNRDYGHSVSSGIDTPMSQHKPKFPSSTRERFIRQATDEGLLRHSKMKSQSRDHVSRRIRLAFAQMAAEDWNLVLSRMALTLDEIDSKMSDNTLFQRDALAWRRLLCSWRVSLVEYATRLEQVKNSLRVVTVDSNYNGETLLAATGAAEPSRDEAKKHYGSNGELELLQLYLVLLTGLHKIEQRVDRSFQAIMSSMSILESERAIVQGAAITRLTELAFFFIPLSFAATFFSMQIQEYDTHRPQMGHFFLMGFVLLVFLYTLRAAIRSTMLKRVKSNLENQIRESSKVHGSEDIPTRVVVSFLWNRLPSLTRIGIIVLPPYLFILLLILFTGPDLVFKHGTISVLSIVTAVITALLILKHVLWAMRVSIILLGLLAFLRAACSAQPNLGVIGTVLASGTTICGLLWAITSKSGLRHVWRRLVQLLLPAWLLFLPTILLVHYYDRDNWQLYQVILGTLAFAIIFGGFSNFYDRDHRWLPKLLSLCALICGIPLTVAWAVWPMAKPSASPDEKTRSEQLSFDMRICISAFSCALFLVLAPATFSRHYRRSRIWWHATLFIVLLALPVTLVWYILPTNGHQLPGYAKVLVTVGAVFSTLMTATAGWDSPIGTRFAFLCISAVVVAVPVTFVWAITPLPNMPDISIQAKISTTLGSVLVLAVIIRVLPYFHSELWRLMSWFLSGLAMMSWVPLFIWATDWKAFGPVRRHKSTAIHVTWGTALALLLIWLVLWKHAFSTRNTWIPMQRRKKKRMDQLVETSS